ncbi:hypothetical protein AWM70_06160 [Paenibacillus yonginensis]|uniref:YetF C-terminal domain-containing protein n=1 Tax=Paenibacillus yonginensis TaxID=1462996 RepID=A0A1B1MYI2_9BACL|nr:DUF421 domain-containing protein [Paenibacillus yonginensis]ANS74217.1 hypothetical protein AWM70_06160 [Paenibacillus yonginensis]
MPQWVEIIIRTLITVVFLFLLTRLLGKRQISQLSFFEYITGITIGDIASAISLNIHEKWYLAAISLTVWVLVSLGIEFVQLKSQRVRGWLDGKGTILIKDGKVMEDNLKKERLTNEELLEQLRKKSVFRVAEVQFAVMEPNGEINVLLKKEYQPLTPSDLGVKVAPESEPQTVILDGKIMDEPLATAGFNHRWLNTELEKQGVSIDNVFIGQVDTYGQLFIDTFDDKLKVPEPQEKPALLATLKKCEADLEMFALSTNNKESKSLYEQCSKEMQKVIDGIRPLLIS